jgi:hypothetical protein
MVTRTRHNVTCNVHCVSHRYLRTLFNLRRLLNRKAVLHLQFVLSSVVDDLWICIWFWGSNPVLYECLTDNKGVEFGVGQNVGWLKWRDGTEWLVVCPECLLPLQILLRGARPFICLLNVASCLPCHQAFCTGIIFEDAASNCKSGVCLSLFCELCFALNRIHYFTLAHIVLDFDETPIFFLVKIATVAHQGGSIRCLIKMKYITSPTFRRMVLERIQWGMLERT